MRPVAKTAVVSGGGSGIGRAIAQRLSADGYQVATIDLQPSDAKFAHAADVTDPAQVDRALAAIREELGTVTILVSEEAGYITGQILGVNGGRNT